MRRPPIELQRVEPGRVRLLVDVDLVIRGIVTGLWVLPWMAALGLFWMTVILGALYGFGLWRP